MSRRAVSCAMCALMAVTHGVAAWFCLTEGETSIALSQFLGCAVWLLAAGGRSLMKD